MTTAFQIRQAALALRNGGVIAYPTEAVFGLGCDPLNATAVARLLVLKRRPFEQGLILLAARRAQLDFFVDDLAPDVEERVSATWPGPVTWVLPARPATPEWITGGRRTVAVRVTAHPAARALCATAGMALVSTSANRRGRRPATRTRELRRTFGTELDYVLPGTTGLTSRPSEIRNGMDGRVLRPGGALPR